MAATTACVVVTAWVVAKARAEAWVGGCDDIDGGYDMGGITRVRWLLRHNYQSAVATSAATVVLVTATGMA